MYYTGNLSSLPAEIPANIRAMRSIDPALVASELRVVLGQLVRRLRAENRLPLTHGAVLGRLDREGTTTVSALAAAERVRPQSMAQTVGDLENDGLITRQPDPVDKRRALIELTPQGREILEADRRVRDGWLAQALVERLSAEEQAELMRAVALLRRLADG
jgi:DNA-binding MarR family transcriptional regulator